MLSPCVSKLLHVGCILYSLARIDPSRRDNLGAVYELKRGIGEPLAGVTDVSCTRLYSVRRL